MMWRQGVPLGARLQGQDQQIVGAPDVSVAAAVEVAHDRARHRGVAVADHQVDRVEAPEAAGLRPAVTHRDGQREDPSRLHQASRGQHVTGLDVIERPELVVGAPATPVRAALGERTDGVDVGLGGDQDVRREGAHSSRIRTRS